MTTPTPAQQLEEVLALLEKATPAPWTMDERATIERTGALDGIYIARPNGTRILETFANCSIDDETCEANAALIVSLVNAAPLLRRALAALEAVEEYEFGVWQDDGLQASGHCADLDDARREAAHYAMMYGQDGPVEVRIYGKRLIPADAVEVSRG